VDDSRVKAAQSVSSPCIRFLTAVMMLICLSPFLAVAAEPDVLISTTGEKFIGELESATAAEVTFKSQSAGEITVAWTKVKELHSTRRFAVIPKNVKISGEGGGEDDPRRDRLGSGEASHDRTRSLLASNPSTVKDVIYQANLERDQYLAPRVFALGQMTYDHNYSQNLNLGWTYQGGLGWAVWEKPGQELDLKGTAGYIQRLYYKSAFNKNLFASTFGESYRNKRKHGVEFHEELDYIPAWNDTSAYAAAGKAGLSIPISESFSLDFNSKDSFLNGVPAAYRKNSFEFSIDLSYTP